MNHLDFARYHSGMPALAGREYDPAALFGPQVTAAPGLRWRLLLAAMGLVFGAGVVAGLMLGQGSPRPVSGPNVCRADEVSRIDCVHVTAPVPPVSGVAR